MILEPKPLAFRPVYKSYLWGGRHLPPQYNRADAPEVCAESWEISGHSEGMGVVDGGAHAGETLDALARRFGAQLTGRPLEKFPLIFKLINARERLSVQVHPSDAAALAHGGEAKSEMWFMLGDGKIYAGLRGGVDEKNFRAAIETKTVESLLVRHDVREGDAIYIPGGLIHAIGENCLVYEVQQSSDTTYRLFDWERNRRLHIEEGMRVTDWRLATPQVVRAREHGHSCPCPCASYRDVVRCEYFYMRELILNGTETVASNGSCHALFVKRGTARVSSGGETMEAACGKSVLLPACCGAYALEGDAEILITTL